MGVASIKVGMASNFHAHSFCFLKPHHKFLDPPLNVYPICTRNSIFNDCNVMQVQFVIFLVIVLHGNSNTVEPPKTDSPYCRNLRNDIGVGTRGAPGAGAPLNFWYIAILHYAIMHSRMAGAPLLKLIFLRFWMRTRVRGPELFAIL